MSFHVLGLDDADAADGSKGSAVVGSGDCGLGTCDEQDEGRRTQSVGGNQEIDRGLPHNVKGAEWFGIRAHQPTPPAMF